MEGAHLRRWGSPAATTEMLHAYAVHAGPIMAITAWTASTHVEFGGNMDATALVLIANAKLTNSAM